MFDMLSGLFARTRQPAHSTGSEQEQAARLMDLIGSAVLRLDQQGRIVFASRQAESVLGLPLEALSGMAYDGEAWNITHVDGTPFPPEELPFVQVMQTGNPVRGVVHAIELPGAGRRVLSINAAPDTGPGGIEGVVCVISDVTALTASQDALRMSEERLRTATEAAKMGVWSYRPDEDRVYFSEECFKLMRVKHHSSEMTGDEYRDYIHPEDRERVVKAIYDCISGKAEVYRERIRHRTADGSYMWTLATGRIADRRRDGRTRVISGTFQDISDVKEYERLIAESRDAAERANEAKSRFLANTSHEIRTPLNGVLGMARLLANTELNERQRFYVETLRQSGQALLSLIENILDISRIEAGEIAFDREDFDLHRAAQSAVSVVASTAIAKQLDLRLAVDPSLPAICHGDVRRLKQVLINLLGNAVKFTEAGHVHLNVLPAGDGCIRFEVADTGPGLEDGEEAMIFSRFTQADSSATRRHEGTGLGLAISKELVELAGGEIGVESEKGKGSVFHFTWPLPAAANLVDSQPSAPPSQASAGEHGLILIVEDNETNLAVLDHAIRNAGYRTIHARTGREALEILSSRPFSLVLMDLHMPELGGEEAVRILRAGDTPNRNTPVFTLSADVTLETRSRIRQLDVQESFTKPLDLDALTASIGVWTRRDRKTA
ncbi:MAG: ATP-binding protein [Caulobacterales bacterium]|uniref:ATP-binding protein n=1 Tax=Glycocaulis sp. TaxID=1969725 RepID=UPI003FA15785